MEKKGRGDERQVIKRQEKEWWVRYWGVRGRSGQRERGVMVGKGCGGGEERGKVRVDRVESRNMLMGERGEF
jgi:hypothetical protein